MQTSQVSSPKGPTCEVSLSVPSAAKKDEIQAARRLALGRQQRRQLAVMLHAVQN
jgi:hypothetical protein